MPDARTLIEVFYAYAPEDEKWAQELQKHLTLLQRQHLITTWHPRLISAGEDWQQVIDKHLQSASIILLLISPDFLASDYCYSTEMTRALEREQTQGVRIVPILLRPVDWKIAPFAHLYPLPSNAQFLTQWSNTDQAFTDITISLRRTLEDLSLLTINLTHTDFPTIWNVPFAQNPFFFGRDDLLARLHTSLQTRQTTALSQPQAFTGLGGIGKTQLAVEYAYRFRREYKAVLWARAESTDTLSASYTEIALLLNLPERNEQEQPLIIQATKRWLQTHRDWLLILDNADEPDLIAPFLPHVMNGHLLITTRATALRRLGIANPIAVETFAPEEGALLLLRRAGLLLPDAPFEQATQQDQTLALEITRELGGLPLALDQSGAYLEATGTSLASYQQIYQQHRADLLKERRGSEQDHPDPVATTWLLSFQRVETRNAAAAELLRLCAFLAPDALGEEILLQGRGILGSVLSAVLPDPYLLEQAFEALRAYSLITRDPFQKTLTVHRLVQAVIRDSLPREVQREWMQRAVSLINAAFPRVQFETWAACERCLSHAFQCVQWIEDEHIVSQDAVRLLNQMGYYLTERARYKEAEPVLQRALTIAERELGSEHLDTATSLHNLASLFERQGKYAEAERLYQRALDIRQQKLGETHLDTATSLNDLALLYARQGKYVEAEPLLQRALAIREQQLGPEHPQTATSLNIIAYIYEQQGKYVEAEPVYHRALTIREQQLGPEHPSTATSLNNLALLYARQGKYMEAEPLLQRALTIREKQLGPEHPRTATSLNNLAYLYRSQGKYIEAEPLYQQALDIREQQLGDMHPDTASSLNNLGVLYTMQKEYTKAESYLQRALTIREKQLGETHPDTATTLNNLASVYEGQGRYVEAERLYRRVLTIRSQQLGQGHPDTIASRENLAALLQRMKPDENPAGES
jgi:tetratricopeptide (TPR) repeat protein